MVLTLPSCPCNNRSDEGTNEVFDVMSNSDKVVSCYQWITRSPDFPPF